MTAAMVPQGREPILRVNYDSCEGHCGIVRIYQEGYRALKCAGLIPRDAMFRKNYHTQGSTSGAIGIVCIIVPSISKEFHCVGKIQPKGATELLIYEVEHKHTAGAN